MVKLYVVNNWLDKVDKNEKKESWTVPLIKQLLGHMEIRKNAKGKPYILGNEQYINWSHNNNFLVIAVSELGQIGVDIEMKHLRYNEQLHDWVLHKDEKNKLAHGKSFSEIWTRKEAILKCTGEGISENMCEFSSYHSANTYVKTLFFNELCISVCSEYQENIELYSVY